MMEEDDNFVGWGGVEVIDIFLMLDGGVIAFLFLMFWDYQRVIASVYLFFDL